MKIFDSLKTRWIVLVWNHTPNCAEMSRLASRSLEQPLSVHTRLKLPAGEHRVAIRCYSALSGVEPLSESEGSELLSRTVLMKVLH